MKSRILLVLGLAVLWCGAAGAADQQKETLWVVPHTHWEGAVFKTREEYLEIGLTNITKALRLLKQHPDYRFSLDQVCYVKPFLERHPEEVPAFRQFVKEGRLQIVGGVDTMHDNNIPGGESVVRQMLYGKGYYREKLGVDVTAGWALDTFGHNAQMPQILKLAGYKSYWCRRGVPHLNLPAEFFWQGIDGTRIPVFWLPYGYGMFYGSPRNLLEFAGFANDRFAALTRYARGPDRVVLAGADVSDPEEHLPVLVQEFNRGDAPFRIRFAVPAEFEAIVAKRPGERPVLRGELNPVFQGIYSSRIEVKQWMRNLERLLTTAEKLSVLAQWLGWPADREGLARAWEPVLFNQAHDLASGVMVDKVFEDSMRGYQFSHRLAEEFIEDRLEKIVSQIDTRGEGIPIVVFNSLGWPRTDITETEAGFSDSGLNELALVDPEGNPVALQVLEETRYGDGGFRRARIAFVARHVPAMGYSVYRLIARRASKALGEVRPTIPGLFEGTPSVQDSGAVENEHYIAFGAIERPSGIEFPAQKWMAYGDGTRGVAVLNRGLPGNNAVDGTLMLSLMRSAKILNYPFHGGYEPGASSDSGLELGKHLTFHYALLPYAGNWNDAGVYRAGFEFNDPLLTRKAQPHAGTLPKRWGLLNVSHPNVATSALKPGPEGSSILRIYEAAGKATAGVRLRLHAKIAAAHEANLIEDGGARLATSDDTLQFDLHPFEIKSFRLELQRAN